MHATTRSSHPYLVLMLRRALLAGIAAVALFPAARGSSEWLGWMPMWLLLMPALALWAAEGCRLPSPHLLARLRPAPRRPQAVRRPRPT